MTLTTLRAAGDLPAHPTLRHPHTGLPIRALGYRKDGRAIWPCIGGADDPPADPPNPADPPADPPKPGPPKDDQLGPAGLKALQKEREAREALEKEFAPLRSLLSVLGGGKPADGKTELDQLNERFAAQEKAIAQERTERWRAEIQADKKLTAAQAKRLTGKTREEMAADADDLLAAFATAPPPDNPGQRRTPRPDPAQGARPGDRPTGKDAGLAEAQRRFGTKT